MSYVNPAGAVQKCRKKGKAGATAVYVCAMADAPTRLDAKAKARWAAEVWRRANAKQLSGVGGRRKGKRKRK